MLQLSSNTAKAGSKVFGIAMLNTYNAHNPNAASIEKPIKSSKTGFIRGTRKTSSG